jgi:hypothetical protein
MSHSRNPRSRCWSESGLKMKTRAKIENEISTELKHIVGEYDRYQELALSLSEVAALLLGLGLLVTRWNLPLLGMHSFRQTHTAITSYWLMQGSPWFAYETPVLGAPWSIPFEFPIYQLLVAGLAGLTNLPLDSTGRLVSYLSLVLTIIPVRMLARAWKLDDSYIQVFAILLLTSPIYLFWGTTFLIETFILFFCFWFLAEVELSTRSSHWTALTLAILCGAVAALGKITTFVPFACVAGLILLNDFAKRLRLHAALLRPILAGGAIMGTPMILFELWTRFADAQKRQNPIAIHMVSTSPATHRWYLGTWGQVFSVAMLHTLLRALTDSLGVLGLPILIVSVPLVISLTIIDRRNGIVLLGTLVAFLAPFVLFANAHIVHNYYDTENAIFLICAMAVVVSRLFSTGHRQAGWNLLAVTVASQLFWFGLFFVRDIRDPLDRPMLAIAQAINAKTDPEGVVVIYGQDWSSVIPYYARRRALMAPDSVPDEEKLDRARFMLAPQGGHPVEAIVRCKSPLDRFAEFDRIFADLDTRVSKQTIAGCDVYFIGNGPTH